MTIIERIEELCTERGWSLYELSRRTDISISTLYSCRLGKREPTNETIKRACVAFGITIFQFYHGFYDHADLTDEQKEVLLLWSLLDDDEKKLLKAHANLFIKKNQLNGKQSKDKKCD